MVTRERYDEIVAALRAHPLAARGQLAERDFRVTGMSSLSSYRRAELRVTAATAEAAVIAGALTALAVELGADLVSVHIDTHAASLYLAVSRTLDDAEAAPLADARGWETPTTTTRTVDVPR